MVPPCNPRHQPNSEHPLRFPQEEKKKGNFLASFRCTLALVTGPLLKNRGPSLLVRSIYKQSQAHPALPAGKQPIPGEDNFPPVRKLTHSSRGGSTPGSRDAKGRGLGRDFGGKFGAKAAWQEPGMPAPCSPAAEEHPPPPILRPRLCTQLGTRGEAVRDSPRP